MKDLKNIPVFITLYFLILIPANLIPMIAAYGLNNIMITLNTIFMVGFFNIYTFLAYAALSAFSAGAVSYLLKNIKTSIIASIIIILVINSCSFIIDQSFQFPLTARLAVTLIIVSSTLFGSYCEKLFTCYNSLFK